MGEDLMSCRRGRTVGAFGQNAAFNTVSVLAGDLIFSGRRHEDFAFRQHQLGRIGALGLGKSHNTLGALAVLPKRFYVNSVLVVNCAIHLNHTYYFVAGLRHQECAIRSHIAKALHDNARALRPQAQFFDGLIADDHDAAPSRFTTPTRSTHVDWLTGDDRSDGLAHVHGVGVHHPGHGLFVRIDVRSRHIFFGANEFHEFSCVPPGHALQFALRHFVGIANHAAFGAAKRDVDHRAFPGHPTRQSANFVESDIWTITDTALSRTARNRMLNPKPSEDFQLAVIHGDRNMHDQLAVGILQNFLHTFVQIEFLRGKVEARSFGLPGIDFLFERNSFHRLSDYGHDFRLAGEGAGATGKRSILSAR